MKRPLIELAVVAVLLLIASTLTCSAATVYVKGDSPGPTYDGTSWATAYRTIQQGLNASPSAGEVWVAKGTYTGAITMKVGVALYGGFTGTETVRDSRNWHSNVTTITSQTLGSVAVVTCTSATSAYTRLDGFTIRSASADRGIYCVSSCLTIANNTITGNYSTTSSGGGIYLDNSSPVITNNVISMNTANMDGGGIYCLNSSPSITHNVIIGNAAGNGGGGAIACRELSSPTITNNRIIGNSGLHGGAIRLWALVPTVANNIIAENDGFYGGAINCSCSAVIACNTITGNTGRTNGGAIYCATAGTSPVISSNIMAFNSSGIFRDVATPVLRNNCMYGNTAYDYSGFFSGTNDVLLDPMLAQTKYGNVHIQPGSPCIDAGDDSVVQSGWLDMDSQARVRGEHVDIGADESDETTWPAGPYTIVRVSTSGSDANDGSTWTLAKKTVQAAVDRASLLGGEVWVSAGAYAEGIRLHPYAYVYGGFAGTESERSERDWTANKTALLAVGVTSGYQVSAIDGFTVTDGMGCDRASPTIANNTIVGHLGTGIFLNYASPIITGNTITENTGGGIVCAFSSPTITNNIISGNCEEYNGGGIRCEYSSAPIISGNVITRNGAGDYGGGIYCSSSTSASPTITNNTIAWNGASGGGGIYCVGSAPTVSNNIVAFNSSGIYSYLGSTPILKNNCVYGNAEYDYSQVSAGPGDISADPLLASGAYGNGHIQPTSPCIDAGWNDAPALGPLDFDGRPRIRNGVVDIGADEADDTVWPEGMRIVRVSASGSDANDGSSWALAKRTVQAGIEAASGSGGEVWVRSGTYNERITLRAYVYLYGGFEGTESARSERNWTDHTTILDGGLGGSVVTALGTGYKLGAIDGFTIRRGTGLANGSYRYGGGIHLTASSPDIANNIITGNTAVSGSGAGMYCISSMATIAHNTITGNNQTTKGGAIYSSGCGLTIADNTITGNSTSSYGGGICFYNSASSSVTNNRISANSGSRGGGLWFGGATLTIAGNVFSGNSATDGGAVFISAGSVTTTNNTIVGNTASGNGGAVYYELCDRQTAANNIVAFNSSGIFRNITGTFTLRNNCVYGNTAYDYSGITPGTWDILADPLFVNRANGDYHLTASSPCINSGWNDTPFIPEFDIDGQHRVMDGVLDIGAYEYPGAWIPMAVKMPVFNPDGGIYETAQMVTITCETPDAVIHYTTNGFQPTESDPVYSDPVLVATDLTLKARAYLTDRVPSAVMSASYTITPVATPTLSPDGGIYPLPQHVTISCETSGVTIHYTTNGIDPTESDPIYSGPVLVDTDLTLKARAYRSDRPASAVRSAHYGFTPSASIADAKRQANECQVAITRAIVTAAFSGWFYIEADDRSSGIRVDKPGHTLTSGMRANVSGTIKCNTYGERYISAPNPEQSGPPGNTGSVEPLILPNCLVGGAEWNYSSSTGTGQIGVKGSIHMNNVGMLLTTTGRVTYNPTGSYFVICDGSKITDASGYKGIRVTTPTGLTKPAVGKYVKVTGISSIFKSGTDYYPLIRVRTQADIVVRE